MGRSGSINGNLLNFINNRAAMTIAVEVSKYLHDNPPTGYTHPTSHPASMIEESETKMFVTNTEHSNFHAPGSDNQDLSSCVKNDDDRLSDAREPLTHTHNYEPANENIQSHVGSSHAPATAQKNSDITKAEIEAKLTGPITTHSHSGGSGDGFMINVQALTSTPGDGATVYFGMLPKAPVTTGGLSRIYIRKNCTLKVAEIYTYSGTAGTNETWSLYVRKNNSQDTLIATLNLNTNMRVFSNENMNVSLVAGDYIEIKGVQPTFATNPATTIYGGYLYFE